MRSKVRIEVDRVCFRATLAWMICICMALSGVSRAGDMETVVVAPGKQGFVLDPSAIPYVPWGHNYASVDILQRFTSDPARIKREFAEMKEAGTNVVRIHPEMPAVLPERNKPDPLALSRLREILKIAEEAGIRVKITGLACYKISTRMAWYDAMSEQDRWETQAFFWETIARTCSESRAVFAYDLINEPAPVGKPEEGWYMGKMGDVEFCQRLSLNLGSRSSGDVMTEWTKRMVAAIRKHDRSHLITMGMLPFPGVYKEVADQLDFVSPHLYPKTGHVDDELKMLKQFNWGKPVVIGETFPLTCSKDDERDFLLKSRDLAQGWIGHWPDESPAKLAELKNVGKATIENVIWLSWVELFKELGPEMTHGGSEINDR